MATSLEREKPKVPEGVKEIPETPEIPPHIEREGVASAQGQVTAQVTDDSGQQLIQTPQAKTVTLETPADEVQLESWSHGSPTSALTWFANFWLRLIKKAVRFGWRIVSKGGKDSAT